MALNTPAVRYGIITAVQIHASYILRRRYYNMMGYSFGFSWKGLLAFLLIMIPNMFYFFVPNLAASGRATSNHLIWDIIEHVSQAIFIILLMFLVNKQDSPMVSPYTVCMAILLLSYYVLWTFYFTGNKNLVILLGMATLPVAYFALAEIWLHILPAIIPTAIFGFVHIVITYMDFQNSH